MIGSTLFGAWLFWAGVGVLFPDTPDFEKIEYNGQTLHNAESIVLAEIPDLDDFADVDLSTYRSALVHGEGFVNFFYTRKLLTLYGHFIAANEATLEQLIRWVKSKLAKPNKTLRFKTADWLSLKTDRAICTRFKTPKKNYNTSFVPFEIDIVNLDPFLQDSQVQEIAYTGQTSSFDSSITNDDGNRETDPTVFIYFATWLSSVTSVSVEIGDSIITLTWTFEDNDTIQIDCKNKDVALNGVRWQSYTGTFGSIDVGSTAFNVTINGTREADIYVVYYPSYV